MKTPQIIYDMPEEEYYKAPGLSHSAMKDLLISPYQFWFCHLSPDREPSEPTPAQIFGKALHSAVLDSAEMFDAKFCCAFDPSIYPVVLDKAEELKDWIKANGGTPKGTRKDGWIEQAKQYENCPPIMADEEKRHFAQNEGKTIIGVEDWQRLAGCVQSLESEPEFRRLRSGGKSEVSYFVTDPDTGVLLKGRMDYVTKTHTLDPKTFVQKGRPITRTIADALIYEGYTRQSFLYTKIRVLAGEAVVPFINPFVESDPPHEVRIVKQEPSPDNLYWMTAREDVKMLIQQYADLTNKFGDKPWREPAAVETLRDEDIPSLAWR